MSTIKVSKSSPLRWSAAAVLLGLGASGCRVQSHGAHGTPPKVVTEHRFAETYSGGKVGFNQPCGESPEQCSSGLCLHFSSSISAGWACSQSCGDPGDPVCPSGFACALVNPRARRHRSADGGGAREVYEACVPRAG